VYATDFGFVLDCRRFSSPLPRSLLLLLLLLRTAERLATATEKATESEHHQQKRLVRSLLVAPVAAAVGSVLVDDAARGWGLLRMVGRASSQLSTGRILASCRSAEGVQKWARGWLLGLDFSSLGCGWVAVGCLQCEFGNSSCGAPACGQRWAGLTGPARLRTATCGLCMECCQVLQPHSSCRLVRHLLAPLNRLLQPAAPTPRASQSHHGLLLVFHALLPPPTLRLWWHVLPLLPLSPLNLWS